MRLCTGGAQRQRVQTLFASHILLPFYYGQLQSDASSACPRGPSHEISVGFHAHGVGWALGKSGMASELSRLIEDELQKVDTCPRS